MNIEYNCQKCGATAFHQIFLKKIYKKFGFIKNSHNVIGKGFSIWK